MPNYRRLLISFTTLTLLGASFQTPAEPADAVYRNGKIYTVDATNRWASALAIKGKKLVAVGDGDAVQAFIGPQTEVIDLAGRMVMPGIHDMHIHPLDGGFKELYECSFPFSTPLDELLAKVGECATAAEPGTWVRGGQWATELLQSARPPDLPMLDAVAPNNPVFLWDATFHATWLNSKALEVLGIGPDTPDPEGGVIVHDDQGNLTGVMFDNAVYGILGQLRRTDEQHRNAALWSIKTLNGVGVVAMKSALADGQEVRTYAELDRQGLLNIRVATSRPWNTPWTESPQQQLRNIENWQQDQTENVRTAFIKIMLDGIPPTRTAAFLEPYVGTDFRGEVLHPPAELNKALIDLDKRGLTVKMHATGDAAARVALDAIEAARKANGDSGLPHEISHAEFLHPKDLARFKPLHATAELSPIMWYPSPFVDVMSDVIGAERTGRFWPVRDLINAGAMVVYGSDWPSVSPSANPWPGIEALITRRDPYTNAEQTMWGEQSVDLATALKIFTRNGSVAMGMADTTGSLEVGKSADFIVLDRNLFEIPIEDISDTKILRTVFAGRVVYVTE